jgi:hypothetical protein
MNGEIVICGVPFGTPAEKDALRQVKDGGFTAVQIYTYWREFEPTGEGQWNWDLYDRQVRLIQEAGLQYVPFLLMGPRYAAPPWWMADPRHVGLRCLEHDKPCPVESVWNPAFYDQVRRVTQAFADHYLPWGVIESVQPGIGGDYGEALFPALGNWPGAYHTHRGWWCSGPDARASFRDYLKQQYGTLEALNRAWRSRFRTYRTVEPFLPAQACSRTALFDQASWYRDSITRYAEFWMQQCRQVFPGLPVYLCTGGADDELTSGALFADQAKVAAKHGGGLRLTNEGNKFTYNFPLTAPTHAACVFYGAYFGLEPVGPMTPQGVLTRTFGSAAFGNRQVFHYYGNLFDKDNRPIPAAESVRKYASLIGPRPADKGIAFFWPVDQATLHGSLGADVPTALNHIRRQFPTSPVSEQMILDGALAGFRCMVMVGALTARAEVLRRIARWVRHDGGLLLAVSLCRDLELQPVPEFEALFGITADSEEAWGHHGENIHAPAGFSELAKIPSFHSEKGWLGLADDVEKIACAPPGNSGASGPVPGVTDVHPVSALFRRTLEGGGQAIFYGGFVNFQHDPQALFTDSGVSIALLNDVCAQSGVPSLGTQDGEVARARVDGKLLILRDDAIVEAPLFSRGS